jgi:pSer/pThr/pTyr-binding forkhead associated (FHA) protein
MAFLMGRKGSVQDRRYEIEKDATAIGRRSENEVCVDDVSVSGRHAVILREGARYRLRDLDSTNGTIVNGVPVRDAVLAPRDIIGFGDIQFEFNDPAWAEVPPAAEASATPSPTVGIKPSAQRVPSSFQTASPFGERRDFSNIWMALILLASILAAGAAVVFIVSFFLG